MREVLAYSTFALTVSLALARPRVTSRWQIGPASAAVGGVFVLFITGIVRPIPRIRSRSTEPSRNAMQPMARNNPPFIRA